MRVLPATCMTRYERIPFEDAALMVTSDYRTLLTSSFGADYMTPRREASHDNAAHKGYIGRGGADITTMERRRGRWIWTRSVGVWAGC